MTSFNPTPNIQISNKVPKKIFDIQVLVGYQDDGQPIIEQHTVEGDSIEEIAQNYSMCGQRIRLLSQRDNPAYLKANDFSCDSNPISQSNKNRIKKVKTEKPTEDSICCMEERTVILDGGIKLKLTPDGKIFRETWVDATPEETKRLRVVSAATGKEVTLKDKLFQLLKFVEVSDGVKEEETSIDGVNRTSKSISKNKRPKKIKLEHCEKDEKEIDQPVEEGNSDDVKFCPSEKSNHENLGEIGE